MIAVLSLPVMALVQISEDPNHRGRAEPMNVG